MNPDERRQIPIESAHLQHDSFVDILFCVQSKAVDPEVSEAGGEIGFGDLTKAGTGWLRLLHYVNFFICF
jgi:hypothetical protein